jgi:threonine synthase
MMYHQYYSNILTPNMPITLPSDSDLLQRSMWRYHDRLTVVDGCVPVSLGEGQTPLLRSRASPPGMSLFYKNETVNPTGSQKDRALSVSITKAVQLGHETVMLYSDGSTALASAAYAARAGLRSFTLVARGTPDYRLLPLVFFNSTILEYQGSASEALAFTSKACRALNLYETTTSRSGNPYGIEGIKTISYEIAEQLGDAPSWIVVPVGGGGTLCGIWKGFCELYERGDISKRPRMAAVLPSGYGMLERAMTDGVTDEAIFRSMTLKNPPATIQAKTAMAFPPDGLETIRAIKESDGLFFYADDKQALRGQELLGREGIFAEPSAAAVMAAIEDLGERGLVGQPVVALVTGSGYRELGSISDLVRLNKNPIEPASGISEIRRLLDGL